MPPKLRLKTSSRGRGKGISLGIPAKAESQSGLSTQTEQSGSSTQKYGSSTQAESSTQLNTKPESSTQKTSPSDYAMAIPTLQALQDCGLTTLPSKTWKQIFADEFLDQNLQTVISNLAQSTVTINPKETSTRITGKEIIEQPQPLYRSQFSPYIQREKFYPTIQMEPEFWDSNPNKVCPKIFPSTFLFKPISPKKNPKVLRVHPCGLPICFD